MVMDTAHISRRIKSIAAILSLAAFLFGTVSTFGADGEPTAGPFHRPASVSERTLDALLTQKSSEPLGDEHLIDFLIDYKGARQAYQKMFGRYFSVAYLDAVAAFERDLVAKNCGGEYVEGDMCGLESSPVNCAQDDPPNGYHYRTEYSAQGTVIILAAWERSGPWTARYRMKMAARGWVIDGVECPLGDRYNW